MSQAFACSEREGRFVKKCKLFISSKSRKKKMLKIAELRDVSQLACSEIRAASFVDCADSWWLFKKNCVRYEKLCEVVVA